MNGEALHIDKVLIADDHPIITDRIRDLLKEYYNIRKLLVFNNSDDVINEITDSSIDLYILDLEFKGITGFDLIKLIRSRDGNAKIIINTMHDQVWTIYQLQQLDVNGVILKSESAPSALCFKNAIDAVMKNSYYYSPLIEELQTKISKYRKRLKTKQSIPTEAELAVLRCIVQGHTSKEIGALLHITEDTVEGHRKNLFLKLDAKNVAHLVAITFQNHLLE